MSKKSGGSIWLVGAAIVFIPMLINQCVEANKSPEDQAAEARHATELQQFENGKRIIGTMLKAPASAQWPDYKDANAGAQLVNPEKHIWNVWGFVDAQNSFGVLMRSDWEVIFRDGKAVYIRLGDKATGWPKWMALGEKPPESSE